MKSSGSCSARPDLRWKLSLLRRHSHYWRLYPVKHTAFKGTMFLGRHNRSYAGAMLVLSVSRAIQTDPALELTSV